MKSLLYSIVILIILSFQNIYSQACVPIDGRNVGGGGTHATICFFTAANVNMGCLDCQLAGASGWKCGAGFAAVSSFHHATINGVQCFSPSALPIELIEYSAENKTNSIILTWTTLSERENDYFLVQRSKDGAYWEEIGKIKGAGTSSIEKTYNFVDENPFMGVSYYRLVQYDFNGLSSDLGTESVSFVSTNYLIYPIPVNKTMFLEGYDLEKSIVKVFNSVGEQIEIEKAAVGDKLSFNFSDVKNGAYFISIENDKTKKTERIIVVHK